MMGFGSCLCPSYFSVVCMTSSLGALANKPPNSSSAAEDMMFFRILAMENISPFFIFKFK